jgi:hypothetical protein
MPPFERNGREYRRNDVWYKKNQMKTVYLLTIVALCSCATTLRGTTQQLQIYRMPNGVTESLSDGQICTTPSDLKIRAARHTTSLFYKEGCESYIQLVPHLAGR